MDRTTRNQKSPTACSIHRRCPLPPPTAFICYRADGCRGSIGEAAVSGTWWLPRPPSNVILILPSVVADPSRRQRMVMRDLLVA
ncbi:hypothetical protein BDA96_01G511800 [Sorghum bicolor]|uniref:Uncharacterized protein n=1 Tax=Sorghum bicolor TaxID=4558 RepID=A0A921V413_SORBI|nr:hypothetical protein BDA96_01G511800 [Sorghum bicolor]KAG0552492.1 hypothetical protein BDA96_01G511800 [Sorghum bicolor]KAG0552493.1 hypothetical protein BDA96_01G511800 [Sorghum bicolor]